MKRSQPVVGIVMGSDSDWEIMSAAAERLEKFGIPYEAQVMSAHRTPARTAEYAERARTRGLRVLIAGAGAAAHLAGVVAAHTTLPVIGVPLDATGLRGFDALLATVQMPAGIPVATVAIGKAGAENAAILAVQILSLSDSQLAKRLEAFKIEMIRQVDEKNAKLSKQRRG
jgi:phosphoribosylaminoimidazole carboxylase PurE protein